MPTRKERDHVAHLLRSAYLSMHQPSGEVRVTRLGFSANPRKWKITAASKDGKRYPGRKGKKRQFRCDVEIDATLSPQWLTEEGSPLWVPKTTGVTSGYLIAGTEDITPPPDIDRAEVIHRTYRLRDSMALGTYAAFRFTKGDIIETFGTGCSHRRNFTKEMRFTAELFRRVLATRMLERMRVTRSLPLHEWANQMMAPARRPQTISVGPPAP